MTPAGPAGPTEVGAAEASPADVASIAAAEASTDGDAAAFLASFTWNDWSPDETATLLFVIQNGRILLIEKHTGLGKGKINGPGGRMDAGETAEQAALREVEEEIRVHPTGVRHLGELRFQFVNGYAIRVFVFRADGYEGEPGPTREATPIWFDLDDIPYDRMWEDDVIWLPLLLRNQPFTGSFIFNGDQMLTHNLET